MKRTLAMLVPAAVASVTLAVAAIAAAASSPAVTTGTHSGVTDRSAVLQGTVNPNGGATTYFFEWGLTSAYGLGSVAHSAGESVEQELGGRDRCDHPETSRPRPTTSTTAPPPSTARRPSRGRSPPARRP